MSGYPVIDVYLSGKELKTAAEVDASIQPIMNVAQLYMSGLKYSFNPHRVIFNKLTDIKLIKDDIEHELVDDQLYRVVANLYTAQMLGIVDDQSMGLLSLTPKDINGIEIDKSIVARLKNPNAISTAIIIVPILILTLVIFIIRMFIKKRNRKN